MVAVSPEADSDKGLLYTFPNAVWTLGFLDSTLKTTLGIRVDTGGSFQVAAHIVRVSTRSLRSRALTDTSLPSNGSYHGVGHQINCHGCSRNGSCQHCLSDLGVARSRPTACDMSDITRSACRACNALCRSVGVHVDMPTGWSILVEIFTSGLALNIVMELRCTLQTHPQGNRC